MEQIGEIMQKMLAEYEEKALCANKELRKLPSGTLSCVMRDGKRTFFQVEKADNKRIRKSINKNEKKIEDLAKKMYLETEIKMLKSSIEAAKLFLDSYEEVSVDNILRKIPETIHDKLLPSPHEDWATQDYPKSSYMPESKVHTTTRGLKVRSKSELLIAEKLYEHGISFRYEQVLSINGVQLAPDFTVKPQSGKLIYWEHCGLTGNKKYMEKHKWKLSVYEEAGIVPWDNLIITYDDKYGILNLSIIESEISNKIKL